MTQRMISAVTSLSGPQPGQSHRSSGNFSTENTESSATTLLFKVATYNPDWQAIHFDVVRDVSGGSDHTIYSNVYDGQHVSIESHRTLYISNPKGTNSDFTVECYQVSYNYYGGTSRIANGFCFAISDSLKRSGIASVSVDGS